MQFNTCPAPPHVMAHNSTHASHHSTWCSAISSSQSLLAGLFDGRALPARARALLQHKLGVGLALARRGPLCALELIIPIGAPLARRTRVRPTSAFAAVQRTKGLSAATRGSERHLAMQNNNTKQSVVRQLYRVSPATGRVLSTLPHAWLKLLTQHMRSTCGAPLQLTRSEHSRQLRFVLEATATTQRLPHMHATHRPLRL